MAKIAIASDGKTLTSRVDPRFGRCPYFLIIDSRTGKLKVLPNTADSMARGAGVSAAQLVAGEKVTAVIAGNFGPKAVTVLTQSGIKIFPVSGKTAAEALKAFQSGEIKAAIGSEIPSGRFRGMGGGYFNNKRGRDES